MVQYLMAYINAHFDVSEEGQGLVEYALILVLVSIVAFAALALIGGRVNEVFGDIVAALGG